MSGFSFQATEPAPAPHPRLRVVSDGTFGDLSLLGDPGSVLASASKGVLDWAGVKALAENPAPAFHNAAAIGMAKALMAGFADGYTAGKAVAALKASVALDEAADVARRQMVAGPEDNWKRAWNAGVAAVVRALDHRRRTSLPEPGA